MGRNTVNKNTREITDPRSVKVCHRVPSSSFQTPGSSGSQGNGVTHFRKTPDVTKALGGKNGTQVPGCVPSLKQYEDLTRRTESVPKVGSKGRHGMSYVCRVRVGPGPGGPLGSRLESIVPVNDVSLFLR